MRIYQVVEFGHTLRDTAPRSHAVAAICAFERFDAMSRIDVELPLRNATANGTSGRVSGPCL